MKSTCSEAEVCNNNIPKGYSYNGIKYPPLAGRHAETINDHFGENTINTAHLAYIFTANSIDKALSPAMPILQILPNPIELSHDVFEDKIVVPGEFMTESIFKIVRPFLYIINNYDKIENQLLYCRSFGDLFMGEYMYKARNRRTAVGLQVYFNPKEVVPSRFFLNFYRTILKGERFQSWQNVSHIPTHRD